MPQGFECYDAIGRKIISVTDRLTRVLDILTVPLEMDYTFNYVNNAFIGHKPFVHFPVFNELILASMVYDSYSRTPNHLQDTRYWLGWNNELNATYFQLNYEQISENTIVISNKFFLGAPNDGSSGSRRIGTNPSHLRKVPIKVIIGVY